MTTDDAGIAEVERRLHALEVEQADLRRQLARAQVDQWCARIDDLQVQLDLGEMEVRDRLTPLMDELRDRWAVARARADDVMSTGSDVVDELTAGLEEAMGDIRDAVAAAARRVGD